MQIDPPRPTVKNPRSRRAVPGVTEPEPGVGAALQGNHGTPRPVRRGGEA